HARDRPRPAGPGSQATGQERTGLPGSVRQARRRRLQAVGHAAGADQPADGPHGTGADRCRRPARSALVQALHLCTRHAHRLRRENRSRCARGARGATLGRGQSLRGDHREGAGRLSRATRPADGDVEPVQLAQDLAGDPVRIARARNARAPACRSKTMSLTNSTRSNVLRLDPGSFALVMATGIVSIDASQHGMPMLALVLLALNATAYGVLVLLSLLRVLQARGEVFHDFTNPARGAGFLTFVAASCVLASQCLLVVHWPAWAIALTVIGAISWVSLLYLLLLAVITGRRKPGFRRSINGGWLVAVVSTQSLAVALTLLVAHGGALPALGWLFAALCLYLVGAALYLILITLIFYRLLFLPLAASGFTPPYWINMGALAITTLAGALLVLHAPAQAPLGDLVPFVKGFTLFFWATATWWIPLLAILELWRHGSRHVRLRYEVDDWDIVFPLGMYTVGTHALGQALNLDLLQPVSDIGVYISLLAWLLVAAGALLHWRRAFRS